MLTLARFLRGLGEGRACRCACGNSLDSPMDTRSGHRRSAPQSADAVPSSTSSLVFCCKETFNRRKSPNGITRPLSTAKFRSLSGVVPCEIFRPPIRPTNPINRPLTSRNIPATKIRRHYFDMRASRQMLPGQVACVRHIQMSER